MRDLNDDIFKYSDFYTKKSPILKIQLPWVVKIPKGYSLLQLPVPYREHDNLEVRQ